MSQSNTIIRVKLITDKISDDGSGFVIGSQVGAYNLWNGCGVRIQCALFEPDGVTLRDPSNISSVTHVIRRSTNSYMLQVLPAPSGGFPQITAAQWNDGSGQHFEFDFSDVDTALVAATDYAAVIFGNTNDPLAAVDFVCKRPLTILDSGIPSSFTAAADAAAFLAAQLKLITAALAAYAKINNDPGVVITTQSSDGKVKRPFGITNDATLGAQRIDDLEYP